MNTPAIACSVKAIIRCRTKSSITVRANTFAAMSTPTLSTNFWSLLKRGIIGTYHKVSKDYLPLYLNEFQFRFNNRNDPNIFFKVIAG